MYLTGTSDLGRLFLTSGQNSRIKAEIARYTAELSSGQLVDPAERLGAGLSRLSEIDRQLARADGYSQASVQTAQAFSMMQAALGTMDSARDRITGNVLQVAGEANPDRTRTVAISARGDFALMIGAMNARSGNSALFAGRATDSPAVASADQMLTDLRGVLAGAASVADTVARVQAWFGPGGGYEATGYLGDTGAPLTRRVDDSVLITAPTRADDPALRSVLAAAALAALADDPVLALSDSQRQDLLLRAGESLLASAEGLVQVRAQVGDTENRVDAAMADQSARRTALGLMRQELVGADPFAAASRLRDLQNQLETHYALSARLSRLSLADFL